MAVWQADVQVLLPGPLPADYRERVAGLQLPQLRSWSPETEMWGTEDGDRLDITKGPAGDCGVFARFDLREWKPALYARFLSLVVQFRATLAFPETGEPVPATVESLSAALRGSRAARFARDPRGFLAQHTAERIGSEGP